MARIRIVSVATGEQSDADGLWLKDYDPNGADGFGRIDLTEDESEAKMYDTAIEALRAWKVQSDVRPFRDDGEPNRPLTMFTIEVVN